jgi:hypothetical protein
MPDIFLGTLLGSDNSYYKPIFSGFNKFSMVDYSPILFYNVNVIKCDDTHLFMGLDNRLYKYPKSDSLADFSVSSTGYVDYGGQIRSIALDDDYVYVVGDTTKRIRVYDKTDLSLVAESAELSANSLPLLLKDATHIYTFDASTKLLLKYDIDTLTSVASYSAGTGSFMGCCMDNDYIYVYYYHATSSLRRIRKLDKTDLSLVATSGDAVTSLIYIITSDDTHLYYNEGNQIRKMLKSDLTLGIISAEFYGTISSNFRHGLYINNGLLYGCMSTSSSSFLGHSKLLRINTNDLSLNNYIEVYVSGLQSATFDNNFVYFGGLTTAWRIFKASITDYEITGYQKVV